MRLLDLKKHINNAYEYFKPKYDNSNGNYYIDNVLALKEAIQNLYDAKIIIKNELEINIFTIIASSMTDRLIVSSSQITNYNVSSV